MVEMADARPRRRISRFDSCHSQRPVLAVAKETYIDKNILKDKLVKLKKDFDESGYFSNRVDSSTSVDYRFGEVEKLSKELL